MLISASLTVSLSLLSLSVSISSLPHWSLKPAASQELSSAEQDHFNFLFFFIFPGKAGAAREYRTALLSAFFSTGFHFFSYLMVFFFFLIWVVVFTSTERITVKPAPFVSVLPPRVFSLMCFSPLCVFTH